MNNAKVYKQALVTLSKDYGITDNSINYLEDADQVINFINAKYNTSSRRIMYISIISILSKLNLYPEALELYREIMNDIMHEFISRLLSKN